jgi:N-methylhydantoinase A
MRIGVDIGGTFTDFVIFDPDTRQVETFKLPSTPHNPAEAMLAGLARIGGNDKRQIIHGTTVATNALLEGKGAVTALVTTEGFRDVLEIGRQNRPYLYDLSAARPEPLVPRSRRFEVRERVNQRGETLIPLDEAALPKLVEAIRASGAESAAVCLLFSFLYPEHEAAIGQALEAAGLFVSLSSEVLPVFREYERTATTAANAYVSPVMSHYLHTLEDSLQADDLQIMQSNGGSIRPETARKHAVRCLLSGPAGGVVGAEAVARQTGFVQLMTFDMGGTSTDVCLYDGRIQTTNEAMIGNFPIGVPIIDIHTVGSGGGSIAMVDAGGALRVGPLSAGADPGPACYGRGSLPTVTDANLALGRLAADLFLGGEMPLAANRAVQAVESIGTQLDLSVEQAALGIVQVVNAHMARALQVISIERGHDPRDFVLLSFGGAGGLHACDLARSLGIPKVLVPPQAATFSALGMVMADVVRDYSQTVMLPGDTAQETIRERFQPLQGAAREDLAAEGFGDDRTTLAETLDMRYRGQSFEINVPVCTDVVEEFHRRHADSYGYANPSAQVEIVNLRVRATGQVEKPEFGRLPAGRHEESDARIGERPVILVSGRREVPFLAGENLSAGQRVQGPAVIVRVDTTILLEENDRAEVDDFGNLIVEVGQHG